MCIMEARASQHHGTIAQAMAHNVQTVCSDLVMFKTLLNARKEEALASQVGQIHDSLVDIEDQLITIYAACVVHEVVPNADDIGNERELVEAVRRVAEKDKSEARKYETR